MERQRQTLQMSQSRKSQALVGGTVPPRRDAHPEAADVTLFGERLFAGVIRVSIRRCGDPGLSEWAL